MELNLQGDDNPSLGFLSYERVLNESKAWIAGEEVDRFIVVTNNAGNQYMRSLHEHPQLWCKSSPNNKDYTATLHYMNPRSLHWEI
jgi:hypothetical protein